jgi:hypothetical protein
MFQRQVIEKIKANISYSILFSENRAFHGVRQHQKLAPDTSQLTVQLGAEEMRFACWITNVRTQTRIHNIQFLYFSTAAMVTRTHLNVTLHRLF